VSQNHIVLFDLIIQELQDYLIQNGEGISARTSDMDFLLDDFKDLIDDLKSSSTGEQLSWR